MFHVKGTSTAATKATQVKAEAGSLNSSDCYVLAAGESIYSWHGKHASDDEVATVGKVAAILARDGGEVAEVTEGEEDDGFWAALGGKGVDQAKAVGCFSDLLLLLLLWWWWLLSVFSWFHAGRWH